MRNLKLLITFALIGLFSTSYGQSRTDLQGIIETIATGVPNTALKVRTALSALADGTAQTGDIKEIDVNTAYIASNFDATGLGTNQRLGWAICNGNNGTRNRNGRVSIGYDPSNYPVLGSVGGSKDAIVVLHSHTITDAGNVNDAKAGGSLFPKTARWDSGSGTLLNGTVTPTGQSGLDKNMQPYIVTLFIMKL